MGILGRDLGYTPPDRPDDGDEATLVAIKSAWDDHSRVDSIGQIWVSREKLHVVLRTSPAHADYFVDRVEDEDKAVIDGVAWIRVGRSDRGAVVQHHMARRVS